MLWKMLPKLIPVDKAHAMAHYMDTLFKDNPLDHLPDMMSRLSPSFYMEFCKIHLELTPIVARVWGVDLVPTHNYGRIYQVGDTLGKHTDREECEFSITMNLSRKKDIWPFYIQRFEDGAAIEKIMLDVGDAVAYRGPDLYHWRDDLEDGINHQMFFHWVSKTGRFKDCAFDPTRFGSNAKVKFAKRASEGTISLYED